MKKQVTVRTEQKKVLETLWKIRGIRTTDGVNSVVAEKVCNIEPTEEMITSFLAENPNVHFCSVIKNYELNDILPFEVFDYE